MGSDCPELPVPIQLGSLPTGTNHGFVAADIILGRVLTLRHCQYFLKKCDGIRAQRRVRPFLPFLIADGFTDDAFHQGRKRGLVFATPGNLFGEEVAEALRTLIAVVTNATASASDVEKLDRLLGVLARTERAHEQLRGPLLELIVGHCASQSAATVEIGRNETDPDTGARVNIDVLAVHPRFRVVAYECKGRRADGYVTLEDVKDWLARQVPRIRNFLLAHSDHRNLRSAFEIWTTGRFAPEAETYLQSRKREIEKFDLDWKDRSAIEKTVSDLRLTAISRILADHFGALV